MDVMSPELRTVTELGRWPEFAALGDTLERGHSDARKAGA
jgi:hypothetical protein